MSDPSELFPGKHFISTVLDALETKTAMSGGLARVYLMRAGMAGMLIGLMYLVNYTILARFAALGDGAVGVGAMVGALVFGFALVFIYYSKSELLTSNMMIVAIGGYYRATTCLRSLRILALCYLGNFLGGLAIALLVLASSLGDGAVGEQMQLSVDHKLAYVSGGLAGWADLLVRAILCNLMINLAMLLVYNGLIKDDLTKSLAMVMSVFVFAFVGFEHSVANTVLFTIVGLDGGIDVGLALGNLAIVLVGNFIGGGLLIGLYYAYANDDRRYLRRAASRGERWLRVAGTVAPSRSSSSQSPAPRAPRTDRSPMTEQTAIDPVSVIAGVDPGRVTTEQLRDIRKEVQRLLLQYEFGLREIGTKIEILRDEFLELHDYNPIEHVSSRVKSPESLLDKLARKGLGRDLASVREHITDIAGIRITCSFTRDVYRLFELLTRQDDVTVLRVSDYIAHPKPNGYQSLHAIVEVPVFLSSGPVKVPVEVQFRTIAMDFWASLEHKIHYKYAGDVPERLTEELREAAATAGELDARMARLHREIHGEPAL